MALRAGAVGIADAVGCCAAALAVVEEVEETLLIGVGWAVGVAAGVPAAEPFELGAVVCSAPAGSAGC